MDFQRFFRHYRQFVFAPSLALFGPYKGPTGHCCIHDRRGSSWRVQGCDLLAITRRPAGMTGSVIFVARSRDKVPPPHTHTHTHLYRVPGMTGYLATMGRALHSLHDRQYSKRWLVRRPLFAAQRCACWPPTRFGEDSDTLKTVTIKSV